MASYHLSVKTVKRSEGRSATAAAAYRAGQVIPCDREGKIHDYTRKQGIEDTFLLLPTGAPEWAADRAALWNAAEAKETRRNSVVAREWELALPSEVSAAARAALAREFGQALVDRYGVAVDVAVHAPHREGDQRNYHAHIMTTTRVLGEDGLGAKTRILDAAKTGGAEIEDMRGFWAGLQNRALEIAGQEERVDNRSLERQREVALDVGDDLTARLLDRAPEIKLGPAASAMERRAQRGAEQQADTVYETMYEPVTERGARVLEIRLERSVLQGLYNQALKAREAFVEARVAHQSVLASTTALVDAFFDTGGFDEVNEDLALRDAQEQERLRLEEVARRVEAERLRVAKEEALRVQEVAVWRVAFIEKAALAWDGVSQIKDADARKEAQNPIVQHVARAAETLGEGFEGLAADINTRVVEVKQLRLEHEAKLRHERSLGTSRGFSM